MKKNILIAIMAIFLFACSGDDVKELTRTTRSFTLVQSAPVSAAANGPLVYTAIKEFDATSNITGLSDKLDTFTLNEASMKILNYSTTLVDTDVLLTTDTKLTIDTFVLTITDPINLNTAQGSVITLNLPAEAINLIQTKLLADKKLTVEITAAVDNVPVDFTIELTLDVTVSGTLI